jgi:hypothetical protein
MAVLGVILAVFATLQLFNPYLVRVEDKAWLEQLAASRGDKNAQVDSNQSHDDEAELATT